MKKFTFTYEKINQIRDSENYIECLNDIYNTINRFIDYCKEIADKIIINQYEGFTEITLFNEYNTENLEFAYRVSSKMVDNIIKFYLNNNIKFLLLD